MCSCDMHSIMFDNVCVFSLFVVGFFWCCWFFLGVGVCVCVYLFVCLIIGQDKSKLQKQISKLLILIETAASQNVFVSIYFRTLAVFLVLGLVAGSVPPDAQQQCLAELLSTEQRNAPYHQPRLNKLLVQCRGARRHT